MEGSEEWSVFTICCCRMVFSFTAFLLLLSFIESFHSRSPVTFLHDLFSLLTFPLQDSWLSFKGDHHNGVQRSLSVLFCNTVNKTVLSIFSATVLIATVSHQGYLTLGSPNWSCFLQVVINKVVSHFSENFILTNLA